MCEPDSSWGRRCRLVAVHQVVPGTDGAGSWFMLCQDSECKCICVGTNKYATRQTRRAPERAAARQLGPSGRSGPSKRARAVFWVQVQDPV